jgi:alkanesulfonate monooxygenase SsuD/methylene tetrahydromethanopterin reductase-like flavin-dependent oxidoreductase (luciferase family)
VACALEEAWIAMKFGIQVGPIFPPGLPVTRIVEFARRQALTARDSGFDGLMHGQHFLTGPETQYLQAVPALAHMAGLCPGMYVRPVLLLPLLHPIEAAEQAATLDVVSGGRLILTAAQGYRTVEFGAFGIDMATRGERLREMIEAIRLLWSGEGVSFHGQFYRFDNVTLGIRPLQQPRPPIGVAADLVRTAVKAAAIGDSWDVSPRHSRSFLRQAVPAFRDAVARQGLPPKPINLIRELCVGETTREAEAALKAAFESTYHTMHQWAQPGERYDRSFEELARERAVVGDPKRVIDELTAYQEEFGFQPIIWFRHYHPGMDLDRALLTLRLFGAEVIPVLRARFPD